MRVNDYKGRYVGDNTGVRTELTVEFCTNDTEEGEAFRRLIDTAYTTGKEIDGEVRTITPEKIFRCGDATTVIWKDGTKTTVKLMPGAEDSDYGAFTAALAKKIYGGNSKVMKYAGMVQRVKSKAEKKAERKAKHKAEPEKSVEKKYIVSQYGQVAERKGIETDSMGVGEKVIIFAKTEDEARRKSVDVFRFNSLLTEYRVYSDGTVGTPNIDTTNYFGYWEKSLVTANLYKIRVFAKDKEEAKKVLSIIPAPIPF